METNEIVAIANIDIEKIQDVIASAPDVFDQNRQSCSNGIKRYNILKELISQNGMSGQLDKQLAGFVTKAKATVQAMNENRKPFTQTVDATRKEFTSLENELKAAADDLQTHRDQYAVKLQEIQRQKERQALQELAKQKETIRLKAEIMAKLSENFSGLVAHYKKRMLELVEKTTLENFDQVEQLLQSAKPILSRERFVKIAPEVSYNKGLISEAEYNQLKFEVITEVVFQDYAEKYSNRLKAYRQELIEKLPSKKAELEEIAMSDHLEQTRIMAESEKRRQVELNRLQDEAEEEKQKAQQQVSIQVAADMLEATVNSQAEIQPDQDQKVKEAVEIIVKRPAGYGLIFQFWFEKQGINMEEDKLLRMTLARMKSFCEKHALTTGEMISSPLVEYRETFKAK